MLFSCKDEIKLNRNRSINLQNVLRKCYHECTRSRDKY